MRGLRTICRCNNIKHRTIERAIREGCDTIARIAARTGATTGHCGGTCTPVVHDMIDAISGDSCEACPEGDADAEDARDLDQADVNELPEGTRLPGR